MNKKVKIFLTTALIASTLFFQTFVMIPATTVKAATPATSTGVNAFMDLTYLSDLNWESATTSYSPRPTLKDMSVDSHQITLNGTTYAKGLGTHSTSETVYNL